MTLPVELKLGNTSLSLHVIFETLGFFIGFRYFLYLRRRRQDRINDKNRIWIIIGATFGAFFFSRLAGALENPPAFFHAHNPLLYLAYALKLGGQVQPLTRFIDPAILLDTSRNTIVYEQDEALHGYVMKMFSTANSPLSASQTFNQLLCCLPQVYADGLTYNNLFRIIIMNFMDAHDFDVRSIKKSCVHIVNPDGKIIPFETMNLFYRPEFREKLEKLRQTSI